MEKRSLRGLMADTEVWEELRQSPALRSSAAKAVGALESVGKSDRESFDSPSQGSGLDGLDVVGHSLERVLTRSEKDLSEGAYDGLEAIVMLTGRPALLIRDGLWEKPKLVSIDNRLRSACDLKVAIPKVGRVDIVRGDGVHLGTGWMLEEDVLITNRHVAAEFSVQAGNGFDIARNADGERMRARVDFLREQGNTRTAFAEIDRILHLEDKNDLFPDMALLRVVSESGVLPQPIELDDANPKFGADIAVIGYPASDPRNDAFAVLDIFGTHFGYKRLSPGKVRGVDAAGRQMIHDCSTLGGNSGSVVLNLDTGKACGLHFAGNFSVNNYAASVGWLKSRLAAIRQRAFAGWLPAAAVADEARRRAPDVRDAAGYNQRFLDPTDEELTVPLPVIPDALAEQLAPVEGSEDGLLHYTHFSIVMRADRRLPFFTAVNIDGNLLYNFPRGKDAWYPDPRLENAADHQTGEALYAANPLDRGHLVRRLDPAWGETRAEAKRAELETFFFTNCSPQHSALNQKTWLSLEDYVLSNASTHALKVTVFSGPVMRDDDRDYRGVKLPIEFWKVVVFKNNFTERLSATAYKLSQADLVGDLEFVYGEFRTYQVPVAEIAADTGLDFGELPRFDPLASVESTRRRIIRGASDLVL